MPIIHFNHGRWHLLPELWSIFTTALLKGHNPCEACFFLQPTQFKIQNIRRMFDFNYLKKQSQQSHLRWFGTVQKSRAQKPQPDMGQRNPPFPSSSLPTLLSSSHRTAILISAAATPGTMQERGAIVPSSDDKYRKWMHMKYNGKAQEKGKRRGFYLLLELIGLGVIFTPALPSSLPCQLRTLSAGHMTRVGQQITPSELHHNALLFPYSFLPEKHRWANTYTH